MPNYCYRKPKTGEIVTRFFLDSDNVPKSIVVNGVRCMRCLPAEWAGQGGQQPSTWPMKSHALAVHPTQRQEYMEFAAKNGVPTEFDGMGKPIFRSRDHRKRYAELVGATDFDGGYGDPHSD